MNYLEFITVTSVGILPNVWASIMTAKDPSYASIKDKYMYTGVMVIQNLSSIFLLLYVAAKNTNGTQLLGLNFLKLGLGEFGILYAGLISTVLYRKYVQKNLFATMPTAIKQTISVFDSRFTRFTYWVAMMIGVFAEELVYRGYVVLWLGTLTGNLFLWAIISISLSTAIHLYQGREHIVHHILIASMFVGIAVISRSIYMPLCVHMLMNTASIVKNWKTIDQEKGSLAGRKTSGETKPA